MSVILVCTHFQSMHFVYVRLCLHVCVCVCLNLHREVKCKHTDAITLLAWYTKKFLHRYRFWNMYSRAAKCSSQEQGKKKELGMRTIIQVRWTKRGGGWVG